MKDPKPEVSVVIPAYNEERFISACLSSLQKQQDPPLYEIIVADNNSTDKTSVLARQHGVRVVVARQKGYAHAAIAGIARARGRFIVMTDADTTVPPLWLSTIYEAFKKHPDAVAVAGPFQFCDGPMSLRIIVGVANRIYPRLLTATLCGMNMAFRREAYETVGGFSPDINLQADTYLGQKLSTFGRLYFLKNNTVTSSARRFHSIGQVISELLTRLVNVITIKTMQTTIFRKQVDYR